METVAKIKSAFERNHRWLGLVPVLLLLMILLGQKAIVKKSLPVIASLRQTVTIFVSGQEK